VVHCRVEHQVTRARCVDLGYVVRRIAAKRSNDVDDRGGAGIRLKPASVIVAGSMESDFGIHPRGKQAAPASETSLPCSDGSHNGLVAAIAQEAGAIFADHSRVSQHPFQCS
jgi:hypothetical protein